MRIGSITRSKLSSPASWKSLARGVVQYYTHLAALHAVTEGEGGKLCTSPPVPHGVARYNSRGIFHSVYDAFPPYLQPEVSFIEGNGPDMSQATRSSATVTSALDSPMGLNGLIDMPLLTSNSISLPQRRNLPDTPFRTPTNKLASWIGVIETDRYAFETDNRGSSTDRSSISLVAISKDHESKALGTVASRVLQMKVLEAPSHILRNMNSGDVVEVHMRQPDMV